MSFAKSESLYAHISAPNQGREIGVWPLPPMSSTSENARTCSQGFERLRANLSMGGEGEWYS